jgi:hypothetical protein
MTMHALLAFGMKLAGIIVILGIALLALGAAACWYCSILFEDHAGD